MKSFWIEEHTQAFESLDACQPEHGAFIQVVEYAAVNELIEAARKVRSAWLKADSLPEIMKAACLDLDDALAALARPESEGARCKHGVWAADHCFQCEKEGA